MPLDQFIAQTSDPIYWSVIATALMKTILEKLKSEIKSEIKSEMSEQDQGIIKKRIQELGELSHDFISKSYSVNQEQTVDLLKEGRIGGFSIIGKS